MAALSVQRFLGALDARLAGLDADSLRSGLGRYGATLPATQREAFLAGLAAAFPECAAPERAAGLLTDAAQDPELLGDIDAFIEALEAGVYVVEDDYEDGYDEYEPENSEAVGEAEGLLAAADQVFLAGGLALAREAYGRLFQALRECEGNGLSGVDLGESAERYLRAVYEGVADPAERAAELSRVWLFDIPSHCAPASLAAVCETLPADLRGLDEFGPLWTAELTARSLEADGGLIGVGVLRGLLTEAALASAGTDGLARVARAGGPGQADAYTAWIDALRAAGRFDDAEQACREALNVAPPRKDPDTEDLDALSAQMTGWYRWAAIADRAAALAQHRGDTPACVGFCDQAWDLNPTIRRLCALFLAAEQVRQGGGPIAVGRLVEAMSADRSRGYGSGAADAGLLAQALLLAGRLDVAVELLEVGQERYADPNATLLPYLLAAGVGHALTQPAQWNSTVLFALVSATGRDRYAGLNVLDDLDSESGGGGGTGAVGTEPRSAELGAVLVDLLAVRAAKSVRGEPGKAWLAHARVGVDRYLERIVGGQHRRSYPAAARMAAACAEALVLAGESGSYLAAARSAYPRHSSFHRELDKARSDSPLLRGRSA